MTIVHTLTQDFECMTLWKEGPCRQKGNSARVRRQRSRAQWQTQLCICPSERPVPRVIGGGWRGGRGQAGGKDDAVYLPPCSQERRRACKVVTSLMLVWGFRVVRVKCYTVPHLGQGRWPLGMCWVPPVNGRQLPPALTKCQWSRNSVGQSRPSGHCPQVQHGGVWVFHAEGIRKGKVLEGLPDLLPWCSRETVPFCAQRKVHPSEDRGTAGEAWANRPCWVSPSRLPFLLPISCHLSPRPGIATRRLACSDGSSFPRDGLCVLWTLNLCALLLSVCLLLSEAQLRTERERKKSFFPPL